jgi:mRNA interferase RelE/StbE
MKSSEKPAWNVNYLAEAERQFLRLDRQVQARVGRKIEGLEKEPLPSGAKRIQGTKDPLYRIRVGDWRIIYHLNHDQKIIDIVRIRHRGDDPYKGLGNWRFVSYPPLP